MRRRPRSRPSPTHRPAFSRVDLLESRELLSAVPIATRGAGFVATPMFEVLSPAATATPPAGAMTPAMVQTAYGFNKIAFGTVRGDGTGQTIAIVDSYDDPNIQADLNTFDAQFGLPSVTVNRVNQSGGTSYPSTDSTGGWESEEALDVEWAHAMAPGASILLVEANSTSDADLLPAVDYASAHANVVSMSWGGSEFSVETSSTYEAHFIHAGVSYVAATGDYGAPTSWPSASPNVLAVGGTALHLGTGNTYSSESGWSGSGGGPSAYESGPSYQSGVVTQTSMRANPDVAYDGSPSTGFAVYDSFPYQGSSAGWMQVGGTSAGAPQWAALLAIADQGRALNGQPALNAASPQEVMTTLYKNAGTADFHDVTTGGSTGSPSYGAGPGFDYVTGLGSPAADLVVQSFVGNVATASNDVLVVDTSATATAGTSSLVTVTARNAAGAADAGYSGTVHFASSDVQAGLPANYTFTAADAGTHTFSLTLKTAGSQSFTATDTSNSAITGSASAIAVSPAAASQFVLAGLPTSTTSGATSTFTVTARDPYGNVATGYTGSVSFASSDPQASLPSSYTFGGNDKGVHSFTLTLQTPGSQSVTVSDAASGLSASQSGIAVSPAAPVSLTAQAASTSQINLSWTGTAGAGGYLVERSANGSTGWTQVASTAAGTTSYQDSGLSAGTTYYYRVRASSAGGTSAYSNVASATTAGASASSTGDTLWSNSYTPSEDSYSSGPYELGVKFRADVAGTVTGVRFYKQTWMGGYTHVGHLWTSTGTLLASATFTNETGYGWEQVNFSRPVSIAANTVYIVSFSSGGGYFGITSNYFSGAGVDNGPLHALANGVSGGDGVYHYGNGSFPSVSGSGMNFWADVVFSPTSTSQVVVKNASTATSSGAGAATPASAPSPAASRVASTTTSTSAKNAVAIPDDSWPYRRAVAQALASALGKRAF